MNKDISSDITARIVEAIERGGLTWLRGWRSNFPVSLASNKQYNGINALLLFMTQEAKGYKSAYWLTFKEAQKRGGHVKRGEKATPIIFYEMKTRTDKNAKGEDETKTFPFMRLYYVFNVEQCEGITAPEHNAQFSPVVEAERIATAYDITVKYGGDGAFYVPKDDFVQMPQREKFTSSEAFYATLFHEFAHSTGAKHRLNRTLNTNQHSEEYAFEELIAELCSAFVCAQTGINGDSATQNNAAYISSWIKSLNNDKRAIFKASKQAQEACDFILNNKNKAGVQHE